MNKEKTLKIIERLENIINSKKETPEYEISKLYINTWVLGTLNELRQKIELGKDAPYMVRTNTYAQLFKELVSLFYCRNIDPKIRIYAIAVLFRIETRDLIIELYKQIFTTEQRNKDCDARGYEHFDKLSKISQFEIIRCSYTLQIRW